MNLRYTCKLIQDKAYGKINMIYRYIIKLN